MPLHRYVEPLRGENMCSHRKSSHRSTTFGSPCVTVSHRFSNVVGMLYREVCVLPDGKSANKPGRYGRFENSQHIKAWRGDITYRNRVIAVDQYRRRIGVVSEGIVILENEFFRDRGKLLTNFSSVSRPVSLRGGNI